MDDISRTRDIDDAVNRAGRYCSEPINTGRAL